MMILKPKKVKDLKYRVWLRGKRCMMCGKHHVTGHHLPNKNGQRRSRDDKQVCLCFNCHRRMHDNPNEERLLLDVFYKEAQKLWDKYKNEE